MSKYYSSSIAFGAKQTKTERVVVSPTKIGDVTTDAVSGALTVDEVPTLDSLNPVSSDGVARAVIQAGAELPTRSSEDTGKVLTVANSDGDLEWDELPTVDQTYDASSENAQSGTAVAGAISGKQDTISDLATIRSGASAGATAVQPSSLAAVATSGSYNDLLDKPTIPAAVTVDQSYSASSTNAQSGTAVAGALQTVNQVPATAAADANKVLTVNAQGNGYDWVAPAQTTYTAGVGVDITAGVVSADIDGVTIKQASTTTSTSINGSGSGNYASNGGYIVDPGQDIVSKLYLLITNGGSATIHIPGNTFYFTNNMSSSQVVLSFTSYYHDTSEQRNLSGYATALSTTYDQSTGRTWVDEQDIVLEGPADFNPNGNWIYASPVMSRGVAGIGISYKNINYVSTQWAYASDYGTTGHLLQYVETATSNKIAVANPIPAYDTTADAGKSLQVTSNGLAWINSVPIEVVASMPASPTAGTLYIVTGA